MAVPHRKPLVYGKVKRPTTRYDLFGQDEWSDGGGLQQSDSLSGHSKSRLGRPQKRFHQDRVSASIEAPLDKTFNGSSEDVRPHVMRKQQQTSSAHGTKTAVKTLEPAFDFSPPDSDEEEATVYQKSAQKRRRLTPVKQDGEISRDGGHSRPKPMKPMNIREAKPASKREGSRAHPQSSAAVKPRAHVQRPRKQLPQATSRTPQRLATPQSPSAKDDHRDKTPFYTSPKQTKLLSDLLDSTHASASNSPSGLPLTSLSLKKAGTPNSQSTESGGEGHIRPNRAGGRIMKSRQRLIDAMASPRKRMSSSTSSDLTLEDSYSDSVSVSHQSISETNDMGSDEQSNVGPKTNEATLGKRSDDVGLSQSSVSVGTTSQPRMTYSKERSHLADMLADELFDPISQTSSQVEDLLRHGDKLSGSFEKGVSDDETDGDAEQAVASIRSIHELRRAGGRARSQVDIESIFEDVEAEGAMARARRLRGLAALTDRLEDAEVGQHILEHSLDERLSKCPLPGEDVVGQTLQTICLTRLTVGTQLPSKSLKKILASLVPAGRRLLEESGDLVTRIHDGGQKLSKGTCMKVTGVVKSFRSSPVWASQRPDQLSPRLVFLKFLDIVIRQVRQLGDFGLTLSTPVFQDLVHLLVQPEERQASQAREQDAMIGIELVISVLESLTLAGDWAQDGCVEVAKGLCKLGPLLTDLASSSEEGPKQSYHLVLRLILNITNNNAQLCDDFAEPELVASVFGIVQRDFLCTAVPNKTALEQTKLEGIILALGALCNLAEHSEPCRQSMLHGLVDDRSMIDWIAVAFRDQAEIASEASSVEETSSLVAFGYLSVLLCTVCKDGQVRSHVRSMLRGGTLDSLFHFVQEFLDHFRRAEELEPQQAGGGGGGGDEGEKLKSGFVGRFEGVMEALRETE